MKKNLENKERKAKKDENMSLILLPKMNIENHQDNYIGQDFLLLVVRIRIEERIRTVINITKDHHNIKTILVTIVPSITIFIPVTTSIPIRTKTIGITKYLLIFLKLLDTRKRTV